VTRSTTREVAVAVALLTSTALLVVPSSLAARPPTLAEREEITKALPKIIRDVPAECVWLDIRVSRNPRYARVIPRWLNWEAPRSRCIRYARDGFFVLKKERRWRIIYVGSDNPRCSMRLPRDLIDCRP